MCLQNSHKLCTALKTPLSTHLHLFILPSRPPGALCGFCWNPQLFQRQNIKASSFSSDFTQLLEARKREAFLPAVFYTQTICCLFIVYSILVPISLMAFVSITWTSNLLQGLGCNYLLLGFFFLVCVLNIKQDKSTPSTQKNICESIVCKLSN